MTTNAPAPRLSREPCNYGWVCISRQTSYIGRTPRFSKVGARDLDDLPAGSFAYKARSVRNFKHKRLYMSHKIKNTVLGVMLTGRTLFCKSPMTKLSNMGRYSDWARGLEIDTRNRTCDQQ